ncbi:MULTISPECIES: PGPGW domain-containing protein [unclassified Modestobacter]
MTRRHVGHNRIVKTVAVATLGGLLTLAGIALLVLPGPGFVLVAAGLAVLATRFAWARKPLDYAQDRAVAGVEEVGRSPWRAVLATVAALALVAAGVLVLAGLDLPFVNAVSAVVLVLSGLFLVGTVLFARRHEHTMEARAHRPAGVPGTGGAYRAADTPDQA